jgi:hypothetical protein
MSTTTTTTTTKRYVKKRAVCVGIDNFANVNGLSGCKNDCLDMAETLKIAGFPRTHIKILTDEQATKANIMKALDWLTKDTADGDVLVYYHSGHGTQVTDLNNDEADRVDEALVCHDFDWNGGPNEQVSGCIIDDELYNIFTGKVSKGVITDAILDVCFAGSGTKSLSRRSDLEKDPASTFYHAQKYLPPPAAQMFVINDTNPSVDGFNYFSKSLYEKLKKKDIVTQQNNVLWAACQDYQVSYETYNEETGGVRGVFTFVFCRILRRSNGMMSRGEIYRTAKATLYDNEFDQVPALEVPTAEAENLFPFKKFSEIDRPEEIKTAKK